MACPLLGSARTRAGDPDPVGRALVAQLSDNQFLVAGLYCRVDFQPADAKRSGKQRELVRVEEGGYREWHLPTDSLLEWRPDGLGTEFHLSATSPASVTRHILEFGRHGRIPCRKSPERQEIAGG